MVLGQTLKRQRLRGEGSSLGCQPRRLFSASGSGCYQIATSMVLHKNVRCHDLARPSTLVPDSLGLSLQRRARVSPYAPVRLVCSCMLLVRSLGEETPALAASRTVHRKNAGYTGFTTSSFTASREVLQVVAKHAAREKLLDRRSIAYQISRRWIFDYGRSHRLSPFGATWRRERVQFLHVAYLDSLEIRDHLESAQSGVMQLLCICQSGLVRTSVWENGDETEQNGSGSADHLPSGCTFPREATAKAANAMGSAKANSKPFPDAPKNTNASVGLSVLDPEFMLPGMPAWPRDASRSVDSTCQRTSPSRYGARAHIPEIRDGGSQWNARVSSDPIC
jgi:hypothetical protein